MEPHVDLAAAKADAFSFETQTLFDSGVAAEFDFAAGTENALPRQTVGTAQDLGNLAGRAGISGGLGDRPVG